MFIKRQVFSFSLLALASLSAYATQKDQHIVVAPSCLVEPLPIHTQTLSATKNFVLLETDTAGIDALIEAKQAKRASVCGGFMDVTEEWNQFTAKKSMTHQTTKQFLIEQTKVKKTLPLKTSYQIRYEAQVNQLLAQINPQAMWNNLTTLTNFNDRYANSDNGVEAANWLKVQIENLAKQYNRYDVTVTYVKTGRYKQPSVVAKIGNQPEAGVVIGGHMDTLSNGRKPGADDDGSGSVTTLEVARTLLASGMQFKKPIYVVFYAAEEEGLVGSGYVVSEFKSKNIPVDAVIHFDMTGYAYKNQPTMWLINDYTNKELTNYLQTLITTYVKKPVKFTRCGYACSDHASWTKQGYVSAFPFESEFGYDNPDIHTSRDTMDKLSLEHMTDYVKLGVAFVTELAEPVSK